jgi:flavodoxin
MTPSTREKPRLLIAYYSCSGNTRRIGQVLSETLRKSCDVETTEILPTRGRSYLHWLLYSFIPGSKVELRNPEIDVSGYDLVLLGFPKWTLSCAPLNAFICKLRNVSVPRFYLFMTSGGFDEQRFLDSITSRLAKKGCNVVESLMIRRDQIQRGSYKASVDSFAKRVEAHLR